MFKIYVRYTLVMVFATVQIYIIWIYFRTAITPSSVIKIFEPHDSVTTSIPDTTTYVSESTQTSKKPIDHIAYKCNYDIEDFNDMIESITRAMEFFEIFLTDLVVDAAVGTRILQGQLQLILQSFSLPLEIRMRLKVLLINTKHISDHIVTHFVNVMTANEQSSAGEKRLIHNLHWIESGSLWEMPAAGDWQEKTDLDLKRYNAVDDETIVFSETNFSDGCIGAVFENCAVPQYCFTLFLKKRSSEYLITHAILFLLFAKKKNCFNNQEYMERISQLGNPNDIIASFCAKILLEAQVIEKSGFPINDRDLFTEQVLVCSMSGFQQFLQQSWLRTILSWQSKELLGCFEQPKDSMSNTFDEIYGIKKKNKRSKREAAKRRVKRYDNIISAGSQYCSAHFTGVGVACIGIHLRYLLETCAETIFKVEEST